MFHYMSVMNACEKGGEWGGGLALLSRMMKEGVEVDTIAYNMLRSALARKVSSGRGRWAHWLGCGSSGVSSA